MSPETNRVAMPVMRWAFPIAALIVLGPAVGLATAWMRGPDGGPDATALLCTAPVLGMGSALFAVLVASVAGVIAGRICDIRTGSLVAGFTLAWAALETGELNMIIRPYDAGTVFTRLAIEGAIVCAAMCVGAVALLRYSRVSPGHNLRTAHSASFRESLRLSSTYLAMGVGLVAALIAAWVIARTDAKGQTIVAAIAAGIAAAAGGKFVGAGSNEDPPLEVFFVSIALAAIVSPIIVLIAEGTRAEHDLFANRLFAPAMILPLDWAAGALIGVPIGARWVQGSIERRLEAA